MKRNHKKATKRIHNKAKKGKHLRPSVEIFKTKRRISFNTIIRILLVIALGIIIYDTLTSRNDLKEINNRLDTLTNTLDGVQTEQNTLTDKQIQLQENMKILETSKAEKKAEEERLAKEKAEAEEKAKQEEAIRLAKLEQTKVTSRGSTGRTSTTTQATGSTADYQAYAKDLCINTYGWTESDFQCLVKLWNKESGWNPNAHNKSSGAHGIPQSLPASKMASEGADYYTNGYTQIRWGLNYIKGRYGNPTAAWNHSCQKNWY